MVFSNPPCHPTIVPANLPVATPAPVFGGRTRNSFWRCLAVQKPEPKIEPAALPKK